MILNDKDQVLLGRRHHDPKKADTKITGADTWTMPGGKLEYGESFEECALRETREECGLELEDLEVMCINNDKDEKAHFVTIGLFAEKFSGAPQVLEPETIVECKWFDLDNLPDNIYFPSKKVLANYNAGKFYLDN